MYIIKHKTTGEYFTLLGSPHFTDNKEIAQSFDNEIDAVICTEQYIDSNEGYELFGMIDTIIINS